MIKAGCSYKVQRRNCVISVTVLSVDSLNSTCEVQVEGRTSASSMSLSSFKTAQQISGRALKTFKKKTARNDVVLYLMKTGKETYKVGCTKDVQQRLRAAKTWCAEVSLVAQRSVPCAHAPFWRFHERRVHAKLSQFQCKKGGKEVMQIRSAADLAIVKSTLYHYSFA